MSQSSKSFPCAMSAGVALPRYSSWCVHASRQGPCGLLRLPVGPSTHMRHLCLVQTSVGQKKLFGTWFKDEQGASPSWLFVAPTDKIPNKKAIVKVACIPVGKHVRNKFAACHPELALKYAKIYLAIEKLAEDCGLTGGAG